MLRYGLTASIDKTRGVIYVRKKPGDTWKNGLHEGDIFF
jgi:hypothetical protein